MKNKYIATYYVDTHNDILKVFIDYGDGEDKLWFEVSNISSGNPKVEEMVDGYIWERGYIWNEDGSLTIRNDLTEEERKAVLLDNVGV